MEVPQVQPNETVIPVPQLHMQEVVRQVPVMIPQEIVRQVPVVQTQMVERVVEVPEQHFWRFFRTRTFAMRKTSECVKTTVFLRVSLCSRNFARVTRRQKN